MPPLMKVTNTSIVMLKELLHVPWKRSTSNSLFVFLPFDPILVNLWTLHGSDVVLYTSFSQCDSFLTFFHLSIKFLPCGYGLWLYSALSSLMQDLVILANVFSSLMQDLVIEKRYIKYIAFLDMCALANLECW